jgi:ribose transport system permease protein
VNPEKRSFSFGFDRFSALYLWALFILVFGFWTPHLFLTQSTLHSVASAQAIGAMLAIAALVPLCAGIFDLSIGATCNLSAVIVAVLQVNHHWNIWASIAVAIGASVIIGIINGFIVVKLRVDSFIATLGTSAIIAAVQDIVSNNTQPTPPTSSLWANLTQLQVGGFQIVVVYLIVLAFVVWWVLDHTPAGRHLYATGGNKEAARLSGVKVNKWSWSSLIVSAVIAGIAGVLYSSFSGPSLTFGSALLLPAYAAVFLGSTQLKPGRFNIWGTILAVYVLATGVQGLQYVTGAQWLGGMFNGIALIAAVAFAGLAPKRRARRARQVGSPSPDGSPSPVETVGESELTQS